MRRPGFRVSLRSLLIAVAFTTLAAWGYTMRRRSVEFASEASNHKTKELSKNNLNGRVGFRHTNCTPLIV